MPYRVVGDNLRSDVAALVTTSTSNPPADEARVVRFAVLAVVGVALVLSVLAIWSGRDRISSAAGAIDFGDDSYDAIITAPTEPEAFGATNIWTLQSQSFAVFPSSAGEPTARFASTNTAGLFGLEGEGGLVALALVPAGLDDPSAELFISPMSTAVALVGLHPDLTTSDPETRLARLIRVAQHRNIGELAALVDGATPLTQWTSTDRELLASIVADVSALPVTERACPNEQLVDGAVRRCGDMLANSSVNSVLVADAAGAPCALLPPAIERATAEGRAAMRSLVSNGTMLDTSVPYTEPIATISVDVRDRCGDDIQVFVDEATNPDWVATATAYRLWADDVLPLAQLLGANAPTVAVDGATTSLVRSQEITGGGIPTSFERLRVASAFLRSPSTAPDAGLLPIADSTAARLRGLTELLGELYQ